MSKLLKLVTFNIIFTLVLLSCSTRPLETITNNSPHSYRSFASQSNDCQENLKKLLLHISWTEKNKKAAYNVILAGSERVSRTVSHGLNLLSEEITEDIDVEVVAERNFRKALSFIFDNFDSLKINKETAIKINRILTEKLVPEEKRGNYLYRPTTPYPRKRSDPLILNGPEKFYSWLESEEGVKLSRNSPIEFAESIHNTIVALDSFPDGNGRLSRLFSDLALMKAGMPPALYSDMNDYFRRGNALSKVSRSARLDYYEEIVENGRKMFYQEIDSNISSGHTNSQR